MPLTQSCCGVCASWIHIDGGIPIPSHPMPPPGLSTPMLQVVRNEVKEAVRWEGGDDSYQPQLFANVKLRKYWAASAAADTVTGTQAAK